MPADRFSTTTRIRALGAQAAERVYRAQSRRVRTPPRSRLTGRAALLALVVCSLVVALAYPMRSYVSQRSEIEDLRRQAEQDRERVAQLRRLKERWQDTAFVEQQARRHLHFVRPGETGFLMRDGTVDRGRPENRVEQELPWYEDLFEALDAADRTDP